MIVVRQGHDDFAAYRTAVGMQKAGADIFSICWDPKMEYFIIWAKAPDGFDTLAMDNLIDKEMEL